MMLCSLLQLLQEPEFCEAIHLVQQCSHSMIHHVFCCKIHSSLFKLIGQCGKFNANSLQLFTALTPWWRHEKSWFCYSGCNSNIMVRAPCQYCNMTWAINSTLTWSPPLFLLGPYLTLTISEGEITLTKIDSYCIRYIEWGEHQFVLQECMC